MLKKILCGALFLLLAACADDMPVMHSTVYTPPSTPGGRLCMNECSKSRDFCRQSCDLDNRACYYDVQRTAQRDYDAYTNAQFAAHAEIKLLPSDFEHPEACNGVQLKCVADCNKPYDECYTSCGGAVTVTSSCQYMCFN